MTDILNVIASILHTMTWQNIVDIAALSVIVYFGLRLVRETRAGQLVKGIFFLVAIYILALGFELEVLTYLLQKAMNIGLIAILVLFQPELRRTIEKAGYFRIGEYFGIGNTTGRTIWGNAIEAICDACVELSATTTGALIVIEQKTRLGEQIENGTILNATPSKELFGNIFYNKTPLHDGAVIMRDGIILAAACFLPKPQREERINKRLGSRHRAAIGMSENSDAIVIVVSEETGAVSVAEDGVLTSGYTREQLHSLLTQRLIADMPGGAVERIPVLRRFLRRRGRGGNE